LINLITLGEEYKSRQILAAHKLLITLLGNGREYWVLTLE
jgi:hypothetical protein